MHKYHVATLPKDSKPREELTFQKKRKRERVRNEGKSIMTKYTVERALVIIFRWKVKLVANYVDFRRNGRGKHTCKKKCCEID